MILRKNRILDCGATKGGRTMRVRKYTKRVCKHSLRRPSRLMLSVCPYALFQGVETEVNALMITIHRRSPSPSRKL